MVTRWPPTRLATSPGCACAAGPSSKRQADQEHRRRGDGACPEASSAIELADGDRRSRHAARLVGGASRRAYGTAVHRDGDWFGAAVNLAARVAAVARRGEILMDRDNALGSRQALSAYATRKRPAKSSRTSPRRSPCTRDPRLAADVPSFPRPRLPDGGRPSESEEWRTRDGVEIYFCSAECAAASTGTLSATPWSRPRSAEGCREPPAGERDRRVAPAAAEEAAEAAPSGAGFIVDLLAGVWHLPSLLGLGVEHAPVARLDAVAVHVVEGVRLEPAVGARAARRGPRYVMTSLYSAGPRIGPTETGSRSTSRLDRRRGLVKSENELPPW